MPNLLFRSQISQIYFSMWVTTYKWRWSCEWRLKVSVKKSGIWECQNRLGNVLNLKKSEIQFHESVIRSHFFPLFSDFPSFYAPPLFVLPLSMSFWSSFHNFIMDSPVRWNIFPCHSIKCILNVRKDEEVRRIVEKLEEVWNLKKCEELWTSVKKSIKKTWRM